MGFVVIVLALIFVFRRRIFHTYSGDNESILADDLAYEEALKSNRFSSNPFTSEDDKEADNIMLGRRRLSDGSLAEDNDYGMKVLRVANPDDD